VSQTVIIYSDDSSVRRAITLAISPTPASDLAAITVKEFATGPALRSYLDEGNAADLLILDGEAVPEGGMGIARQVKDEILNGPQTLVIIGRPTDAWLANWSKADGTLLHPIEPLETANQVAKLLRPIPVTA
jgi:hypothetical protein